ncbi:hypothetical protein BJX96DRAFT_150736 [Aspergillus floccosus]
MSSEHHLDALVVGTGFAGIYALYSLLKEGLQVKAIDTAGDVGGTWYWNRYPGAMSDTWSHLYRYSFDPELLREFSFSRRYVTQPEIMDYLRGVVAKYDLRRHMQFDTGMTAAKWDENKKMWRVECHTGDVFCVRYLVTAVGLLHTANLPKIPGMETFKGQITHTSAWDPTLTLENKRVGVIGVSSTGVQVVTAIASQVKSLHVFVRRPQFTVPSGDRPLDPEERALILKNYPSIWTDARASTVAMGFPEPSRKLMSLSPQDREACLEDLWTGGNGLRFMFGGFSDIITDERANEEVCRFLRKKIAGIVKDPQKRAILTPKELYARRPLCDNGYYEQFNRDNVHAVDIMAHPITEITPGGIRTSDGTNYDLDVIIFATGFDAMEGSYSRFSIHGRDVREDLYTRWKREGADTYLGMSVSDFPNLFLLNGPNAAFANIIPLTETNVEFMIDLIRRAEEISKRSGAPCEVEATAEAERAWTQFSRQSVQGTLFTKVPSWLVGKNIPGKPEVIPLYLGGLANFRSALADAKARGFEGFRPPLASSKADAHL